MRPQFESNESGGAAFTADIPSSAATPVRLLTFLAMFGMGGTEKQVVNLAQRIDRRRYDLSFACLMRWGVLLEEVERQGWDLVEYPIPSLYGFKAMRQQFRFAQALRRERTQILHSYNFYANVFSLPMARLAGVPCIIASIRDLGTALTPLQQRAHRIMCRFADRIVVNAEAIRNWLIGQGYPAGRISVIYNGLDLSKYGPRSDGGALRREFWLPPHAPLVVLLARLVPHKGIEYFLEAAGEVRRRHPEACFMVVGESFKSRHGVFEQDPAYRKHLQDLAVRFGISDHTRFTGMRSDIPDILSAAAVSVLPSFSEGVSNTLLESMAAGAAVVATRVGGTPEVIHDREHGLLVPPRDAGALAQAICALLDNLSLAARLRTQARERVENCFSFDHMVQKTEALYQEVLQAKLSTVA